MKRSPVESIPRMNTSLKVHSRRVGGLNVHYKGVFSITFRTLYSTIYGIDFCTLFPRIKCTQSGKNLPSKTLTIFYIFCRFMIWYCRDFLKTKILRTSKICNKMPSPTHSKIRTGASPGTFFTVSGTARMVPAEVQTMLIGSKRNYSDSIKRKDST